MSKFPTHGQFDGQTVADRDGVVWKYDQKSDTWINRGVLHDPPIVSDGEDGLVTPEIYRKLNLLES